MKNYISLEFFLGPTMSKLRFFFFIFFLSGQIMYSLYVKKKKKLFWRSVVKDDHVTIVHFWKELLEELFKKNNASN